MGNPMKMTAIMLQSMIMPRISVPLMGSDLDLLVLGEKSSGANRPDALHELGQALQEQHAARERYYGSERPDHRLPGPGIRFLVDPHRVDEVVPARPGEYGHGREEQEQEAARIDDALGSV